MDVRERDLAGDRIGAALGITGLLFRALGYLVVAGLADHYDCGRAVLTGVLLGDFASRLIALAWQWRDGWAAVAGELLLLLVVYLLVRPLLVWPDEPALRGIVALAALAVYVPQSGGALLVRLGPRQD